MRVCFPRLTAGWPCLLLSLLVPACGGPSGEPELSGFVEGQVISGRVVENTQACVVDAVCYLRLEFADTTVLATYGSHEPPPFGCEIPLPVSNAAFQVGVDEIVEVSITSCDSSDLYLRELVRDEG